MENCILRDPLSRENRLCHLNQSRNTVGTSGHFFNHSTNTLLLASVRILREEDFDDYLSKQCLGSGRFGRCYLQTLAGHYQVCVKVLKQCFRPRSKYTFEVYSSMFAVLIWSLYRQLSINSYQFSWYWQSFNYNTPCIITQVEGISG